MGSSSEGAASISARLQSVTNELRQIQEILTSEKEIDGSILSDFRDAVNRVRNTAWALQQYVNSKSTETDARPLLTVVTGERVRVAYQLSKLVQKDLANPKARFQKGQLLRLREATQELARRLDKIIGE